MTQLHSAREVERMSHSPVCVCVCDRGTNECAALCCRSTVFFLHLCCTLMASGSALLPTDSAVTSVTHKRPLRSQPVRACLCECVSQSNYRRIPGQWASLCVPSHTVSYRSFNFFVCCLSITHHYRISQKLFQLWKLHPSCRKIV